MTDKTIMKYSHIMDIAKSSGFNPNEINHVMQSRLGDFARSIEQAVLQSEQVQALKRDSDRYRYLREHKTGVYSCDNDGRDLLTHKVVEVSFEVIKKDHDKRDIKDVLDTAIDAAMEVLYD